MPKVHQSSSSDFCLEVLFIEGCLYSNANQPGMERCLASKSVYILYSCLVHLSLHSTWYSSSCTVYSSMHTQSASPVQFGSTTSAIVSKVVLSYSILQYTKVCYMHCAASEARGVSVPDANAMATVTLLRYQVVAVCWRIAATGWLRPKSATSVGVRSQWQMDNPLPAQKRLADLGVRDAQFESIAITRSTPAKRAPSLVSSVS
jgi:hypothetical protein